MVGSVKERFEETLGLLRSMAIYYAPGRKQRKTRFYAPLIRPGDLCFDIGAHVGDRVGVWLRLGARVVAVEPQAHLAGWLRRNYGRSRAVSVIEAAVGAASGTALIHIDRRNPTVSTLSTEWMEDVSRDNRFTRVHWRATQPTPVTTLDALIVQHGRPALCKIDVEGYEALALRGLSQPLPLISFEYIPAAMEVARASLKRLGVLGTYQFNWFVGESHRWASPVWLRQSQMAAQLESLAAGRASGDIFARLVT